jgi:hypothetical protein
MFWFIKYDVMIRETKLNNLDLIVFLDLDDLIICLFFLV